MGIKLVPITLDVVEMEVNQERVAAARFHYISTPDGQLKHVKLFDISVDEQQVGKGYARELLAHLSRSAHQNQAGVLLWHAADETEFLAQIGAITSIRFQNGPTRNSA